MNKTLFIIGLLIVTLAATFLLLGILPSGLAIAAAMLGIGLIFLSRRGERPKPKSPTETQVVQTIHSADGQMRAIIKQRPDGKYQVEIQRFVREYSQEFGQNDCWIRQSAPLTDSLSSAVEIATSHIRGEEEGSGTLG
jgi:hypothetical protein